MAGLEGTTLGRYQLLGRLGRGGMSEVYLAYDERMDRNVALKVVSGSHADYLERFHREAEAIGRLHHDHILPAFDYGDQEPWHYLVMPLIEHGTLRDRLDEGPLSLEETGEMLQQMAGALQTAHDTGIIHRDIKPSNVLLRDDHYSYLADFGLAKVLEGGSELTQTGALLGTPEYMAPDLADGPATTSSDIYALGVVLYQMLAGRVPFTGETPVSVYMKHVREEPMPPSFYNAEIPRSIDQVVLRALEKNPRRRFQTAQELADAYERARLAPTIHDTQEMPPFKTVQETASSGSGDTPLPPTRRFGRQARQARQARQNRMPSSQGRRLILPSNPTAAPSSVFRRRRTAVVTDPLSETEAQTAPTSDGVGEPIVPRPVRTTLRPRRTRSIRYARSTQRGRTPLAAGIVVVGLVLFIVLPMSYSYYIYSTTPHRPDPQPTVPTSATQPVGGTAPNATATGQAVLQATASPDISLATSGTPLLADSLASNTNGRWIEDMHCTFTGGTYHVKVQQANFLQSCALITPQLGDATVQVDVTLLSGHSAGMLLRSNNDQYYDFEVNDSGQFSFRRHDTNAGTNYVYFFKDVANAAIAPTGQKNTLVIIANGSSFKLYINGVSVGQVNDNNYALGQFAVAAGTPASSNTGEASFSNLKVFEIKQ